MDHSQMDDINEYGAPGDEKVAALLSSLPRVEAPANFEFGLKAKMSAASQAVPQASLIPFAKILAPTALLILVGLFVVFYNSPDSIAPDMVAGPTIQQTESPQLQTPATPSSSSPQSDISEFVNDPPEVVSGPRAGQPQPSVQTRRRDARTANSAQGGSIDMTLESANTKLPPGFESLSPRNQNTNTSGAGTEIKVRDLLRTIGLIGEFVNSGWKVSSAVPASLGQRAGVQAGDIIESINDQRINSGTTFKGEFSPRTLRVNRGGQSIVLSFKN